ncbi:hypothetical protein WN944_028716 [Citrus x changshan-huyou]|uniref:Uncharacterized protein n=1 Tax=Citrus x changshan-huyou TaxID=2935761 RepID=A0AAP0LMK2_9ROSI
MSPLYSLTLAINVISIFIFFLLLSYSMRVDGSRMLRVHDHQSNSLPSILKGLGMAYSGPSHDGRGH